MKNTAIAKMVLAVFLVSTSCVQAGSLITFSNGEVADADDVNANFAELEQRIKDLSALIGNGGTGGNEVIDFGPYIQHSYSSKTFSITGENRTATTETQDFSTEGKITTTRKMVIPTIDGSVIRFPISTFDLKIVDTIEINANGDRRLTKREVKSSPNLFWSGETSLASVLSILGSNRLSYSPGILLTKGEIVIDASFSSSGNEKNEVLDANSNVVSTKEGYFIDTTTPLEKVPSVTIDGKEFPDCITLESNRSSQYWVQASIRKISWYCRGEGLVKEIRMINGVSPGEQVLLTSTTN